jgi:hypothetical protein
MFLDAGVLLERNGWRGFAPLVLLRTGGPLAASIIMGLAWASWHVRVKFGAFIDCGLWGAPGYLGALTVMIVAISVVMTFFRASAGQATPGGPPLPSHRVAGLRTIRSSPDLWVPGSRDAVESFVGQWYWRPGR